MVAYAVNIFQLSIKYRRDMFVGIHVGVVAYEVNIFQLLVKYRRTIFVSRDVDDCDISKENFCLEICR